MAKLDVMAVMFFVFRMAPAIFFILFMMIMFFSFRVEVRENAMGRFVFELSDTITSDTKLVAEKSVFVPEKLLAVEKQYSGGSELYAENCAFGYYVYIRSLSSRSVCNIDDDCIGFCRSVCGLANSEIDLNSNCGCGGIFEGSCQCKKTGGEWQNNYAWGYGYTPQIGEMAQVQAEFPVGIFVTALEETLPAAMTITAYDSFLTRLSCTTAKAYELTEPYLMKFDISSIPSSPNLEFRRTNTENVCLYSGTTAIDCRYLADVQFEPLNINDEISKLQITKGKITAYPLKKTASCSEINPSVISKKGDIVATVVLCVEKDD